MSCAERRERLYDRLYGLLGEADAAELDRHVADCPDCRREWESLKSRDAILDEWTPEYRPGKPIRLGAPSRRLPGLLWAAAALLITVATTVFFPSSSRYDVGPGSLVKADSGASVRLGRAGRLELEPGAEVLFKRGGPDLAHDLELLAGTIHVEVFPTGRAFRVLVGDRTVEVRGTRFSVRRFSDQELSQILGEDSMKRWNLASVSVALVTVTAGTVALSGPEGPHPVQAGRSVLATPAGVEKVEAGESLASVRKYRDELLRALASRETKNRASRAELEALKAKGRKVELPPGATLASLLDGLRAAEAKGDPQEIQQAIALLGLLLKKNPAAFDGILKTLVEARDAGFVGHLCSALWSDGGTLQARRSDLLKAFLAPGIPNDIRLEMLKSLAQIFYGAARVSDAEAAQLLRAAQALSGEGDTGASIRGIYAYMAVRGLSTGSEAWGELQRYLAAETNDATRSSVLQNFFYGTSYKKGSAAAEGLLLDTLRGRYGVTAAEDQLREPLLPWFTPENADSFVGSLKQIVPQVSDPFQRQIIAGQLGLLHLIQRNPSSLEALRQLHAAESVAPVKSRMAEVLQAADKGTLDLDKLMETLQLKWNF